MAASSLAETPRDVGMPFSKVQMEWDRRFEVRQCILRRGNVVFLYPREIHQRVEVTNNEAATQEDNKKANPPYQHRHAVVMRGYARTDLMIEGPSIHRLAVSKGVRGMEAQVADLFDTVAEPVTAPQMPAALLRRASRHIACP